MKTIQENNRMLAEYIGCTFEFKNTDKGRIEVVNGLLEFVPDWRPRQGVAISGSPSVPVKKLKFHTSWDWLIPVVNKLNEELKSSLFKTKLMSEISSHILINNIQGALAHVCEGVEHKNNF